MYNGVTDFYVGNCAKDKKIITIGTIGRLMHQKAQKYFIEMAKSIEEANSGLNIIYEIWGDGELDSELNSMINNFNLDDKVFLKGYASDLKKTYARFNVFVLTSSHEGIPYVILKSMSAKVPVVSTEVGGINEIIINNSNGMLVPFGDVEGLRILY